MIQQHDADLMQQHDARALQHAGALRAALERDGFVHARGWLDPERDLRPLREELGALIVRAARACGTDHVLSDDPAEFDRGYLELVATHPDVQPLVYDMAKNLVSFQRLIVSERLAGLFRDLRGAELCGTAPGANGVRIDRPGVQHHLAPWHQELQFQFRSLDAVTFWIPLVPVRADMGPVVLARGSHRDGALPLVDTSGTGAEDLAVGNYAGLRIADEDSIPDRYDVCAPESDPGDVFAFDFLTLHASAPNLGTRARWTVQIRYFNFDDPFGREIRWAGGLKHGATLADANALIARAQTAVQAR
jgi:hypothetical protein